MTNKRYTLDLMKALYKNGFISKERYIEAVWEAGLLVWDEAIDLICRANSDKRRGKI